MLSYLLGDVLRIFAGDFTAGEMDGVQVSQGMFLVVAALMVIPVIMVFLSLTLPRRYNRWANIVFAIFFIGFNLIGFPGYPGAYDKFLLVVSFMFNALTVWYAWKWR